MIKRTSSAARSRRADRGASLPEYALGVALVAVVAIGAIQYMQERGEDRLEASDARIGTPNDEAAYGGGGGGPGPTTPPPPPSTDEPMTVGSVTASPPPSNDGNKWIANATITVLDEDGDPLQGVLVAGSWDTGPNDDAQCTTGVTGVCSVQQTAINDNTAVARFTVETMSLTGFTFVASGSPAELVDVSCPGSPATCD